MKTNIKSLIAVFALAVVATFSSCTKDDDLIRKNENNSQRSAFNVSEECVETFTLWAGNKPQTAVGEVVVSNDDDFIYINFIVNEPWLLTETHVDIQTAAQIKRGAPGKYNSNEYLVSSGQTSALYQIPLNFDFGTTIYILAHAAVVNSVTLADETAYGGEYVNRKPWYNMITFTVKEDCLTNYPPDCETETAWAAGTRYVNPGNWATYTTYEGAYKEVVLFAGQTREAGLVEFSAPVNGLVTITITLNAGWSFQDVSENVKIQDYSDAPSGNPSIGLFDHKGTSNSSTFSIHVPVNNFYGVHADVQFCQRPTLD